MLNAKQGIYLIIILLLLIKTYKNFEYVQI
jgi:hypothetical protein